MVVAETGGPEVLSVGDRPDPEPGPTDLVVEVRAAGVNFIDTYQRSGLYPMPLPFVPGLEGAGQVVAVGSDVERFGVGDRVAWAMAQGSYAERVIVASSVAVEVPGGIEWPVAAAALLQGMTAHYLAHSVFNLDETSRCLIHAAAGGTGRLLVQMAKNAGAEVFATAGSGHKCDLASSAGADHVINYREVDFVTAVEEIAGPRPLDVVYDGVGAATFDGGLALLRPRGTMVTFGNASGPVPPVSPLVLSNAGSVFLTRPTLGDYVADSDELAWRAGDIFAWIQSGRIDVRIDEMLELANAATAHEIIESRATTGKLLLRP